MLRRAVVGAVTAAVTSTTVLSVVPAGAVQESPNNGINFELPQRWNDNYKPGTRCTPQGTRGVYVTASRRWFKQTDGASVENTTDTAMPVTHTVTVKRSETTEVKGEIKADGTLTTYLNQSYGFDYINRCRGSCRRRWDLTTLLRTPRVVWSGDSSCWMLTPRMLAAELISPGTRSGSRSLELTLSPGTPS